MDKTALITGASSGIGKEFAYIFARENHSLILVARSGDKLLEIKNDLESKYPEIKVTTISKDLAEQNSAQELYSEVKKLGLKIDILVNNAGFGDYGKFLETDIEKEKQMIDLNIKSLTEMLSKKSGKVLNVASTAAFLPGPLMAVYFATKAYALSFSEAVAEELSETGVTVTALCPGPTESHFQKTSNMNQSKIVKNRKLPTAKEVAEYGYKSLIKEKVVAVHGFSNKVSVFLPRILPRFLVRKIVKRVQGRE